MQACHHASLALRRGATLALVAGMLVLPAVVPSAQAVPFNYPDQAGLTVDFLDIAETPSTSYELFGQPVSSGDSLLFNPTQFHVGVGGGQFELIDSQLNFIVQAKAGYGINGFGLSEAGDFSLVGTGTSATNVKVGANILIAVSQIEGVDVTPIWVPAASLVFSPSDSFNLADAPHDPPQWSGSAYVDIADYLDSQNIIGAATKIYVAINNQLAAFSEAGSIAMINKKLVDGVGITIDTGPWNPIPEPSTFALAAIGLCFAGWFGRKRLAK